MTSGYFQHRYGNYKKDSNKNARIKKKELKMKNAFNATLVDWHS